MTRTIGAALLASLLFGAIGGTDAYAAAVHGTPPSGCSGLPGMNQAFIFTGTYGTGTCYVLQLGLDSSGDNWTSYDATTGFPNDAVRSAWTGPNVWLVLFWNNFQTHDNGATFSIPPSARALDMGSWNGKASAARIQTFSANYCTDNTKLNLSTDDYFAGDCTELTMINRCYLNPVEMGFRNDTLSSVYNGQFSTGTWLCPDAGCTSWIFSIDASPDVPQLSAYGDGINDVVSGVRHWNGTCP